jgi:ATP-dependent Lhr-like helicase
MDVAARLGVGVAVARQTLQRLESQGRLSGGFFLPDPSTGSGTTTGSGTGAGSATGDDLEWCDTEVLRRLRLRSLAAIRGAVEPVAPDAFARFLPAWQHVSEAPESRGLEGVDGVLAVIEQLAGVPVPASAWESLILPSRVVDYRPAMLDELTSTGEVVWSGHGSLPGRDGWIALHPAESASLTLRPEDRAPETELEQRVLDALAGGGAFFASQLVPLVGAENEQSVIDALWNLAWTARLTNDTFAPVRMLIGGGSQAHRTVRRTPRARMFRGTPIARPVTAPQRPAAGGGLGGGRWSLLPASETDPALRAAAAGSLLLERYGVVTRGSVQAEELPGGFAQAYRTLAGFEDAGHCRRGYFIERLGAAQFATSSTVDRLRTFSDAEPVDGAPALHALTLAATDPANPYGAALGWPPQDGGHRPGRKAGGLVILVDGELVLYLERGGRSLLAFSDDDAVLASAARSLVGTARARRLDTLTVEQVGGEFVYGTAVGRALRDAGFVESTRGLTLRRAR